MAASASVSAAPPGELPTPSASAAIKGGGRASLSERSEDLIVDLLKDLRDEKNPLLPRMRTRGREGEGEGEGEGEHDVGGGATTTTATSTDHDMRRERRRFVKRLVEYHRRRELVMRLNRGESAAVGDDGGSDGGGSEGAAGTTTSGGGRARTRPAAQAPGREGGEATGKVRVELVEAVYSAFSEKKKSKNKDKKKSSKSKSKSSKNSSQRPWKEGPTKKTLVLARSTPVKDVLAQGKAKLRTKKKPVRCFYVDAWSGLEVDLACDLGGMADGATLYVTSHDGKDDGDKKVKGGDEKEKTEAEVEDVDGGESNDIAEEDVDPLEVVKAAYADCLQRKARRRRCRGRERAAATASPHPRFSDHFDKLPPLPAERAALPAASYRTDILSALDANRVLIIHGATGCGKSTQVPQFLLEGMAAAGAGDDANVLVTQPRRVAATSLAERVAAERGCPPPGREGGEVGYSVRLARAVSDDARIVYCTVGVLLRMLVNPREPEDSPEADAVGRPSSSAGGGEGEEVEYRERVPLSHVTHVLIDEVHERDLNTDFCLTLLRSLLATNQHVRVVLMSATASAELFASYFRSVKLGIEPRIFSIPGRAFPVETKWLRECEALAEQRIDGWVSGAPGTGLAEDDADAIGSGVELSPRAMSRIDDMFILRLISSIIRQQKADGKLSSGTGSTQKRKDGAVLVFLPGKGEIESLARVLYDDSLLGDRSLCQILKLHSTIPYQEQQAVFRPARAGTVKIVLSTNVAETSVTIPDVSAVIDAGRVKESRFNPSTRIKELVTVWTSRASAKQRAGRAGRTGPGVCYRLYTEDFFGGGGGGGMVERTSPEIVRTPLDELVLQVCLMEEHRRDHRNGAVSEKKSATDVGASPIEFLSRAPEPPPTHSLLHACKHLLQVGALEVVSRDPRLLFRLTPLGYHLSHLPMDAKVGKVLIIGCVLECVEPALTIAAALSCTKSCFLTRLPGGDKGSRKDALDLQRKLVESGFGGPYWRGGTVKGDLIGTVAAYNGWTSVGKNERERRRFASQSALDHSALREMNGLRSQFRDVMVDAGFLEHGSSSGGDYCKWEVIGCSTASDDALLTSCCLVAGLYPNIATLMRPKRGRGNLRGGRLITKDGDTCCPSSNSFQADRVRCASETGKDAYVVFHAKHRTVGASAGQGSPALSPQKQQQVYLSEVNFVSRFALLLFGGELEVRDNALIIDGWLKFKVGDKGRTGAVIIQELRREMDNVMLRRIMARKEDNSALEGGCKRVVEVVRALLAEE